MRDINNTAQFYQNLYKGMDRGLTLMGRKLRDDIKERTPFRTGRLKGSMKTERKDGNTQTVASIEEPFDRDKVVYYAYYIEMGTPTISARKMMRSTYDEKLDELEKVFIKALNDNLK